MAKVLRADYVIWTSGTLADTDAQVDELVGRLEGVVSPGDCRLRLETVDQD